MPFSGPLEDRILIRELYGRYADASCRGDRELWVACFAADGQWNTHLFACNGPAEMRAQWDQLWADWNSVAFWGEIGSIEVSGETARVRSYAREIVALKAGGLFKLFGSYDDQLVKTDGEWLFARRDYLPMIQELPQ